VITREERRTLLGLAGPVGLALLLVLPFLEQRIPLALAAIGVALAFTIVGMAIAAPIHPNRK
jgi:hypothetical protein